MKMRTVLILSVSFLGLAGCQTLDLRPEPTPVVAAVPTPPQADWVEIAPENLPTTDWVGSFKDSVLPDLVDEALKANTNVRVAEARFNAALARTDISAADLLPSVSGSVDVGRTERGNSA